MKNKMTFCPDDETLLTFIEGTCDLEIAGRVLEHVQTCADCKDTLAFVCKAIVLEKRGELKVNSPDELAESMEIIRNLLDQEPTKGVSQLWKDVFDVLCPKLLQTLPEPEVIAAAAVKRRLIFCSLQAQKSNAYWTACINLPKTLLEDAVLEITVKDAQKIPVAKGMLTFCGIEIPIQDGKGSLPLQTFRDCHGEGGIQFAWEDGRASEGVPILSSIEP